MTGKTYCDSIGHRLGESFPCLESAGHPLPHQGPAFRLPLDTEGCPECGRLESHDDDCSLHDTPIETDDGALHDTEWHDDGAVDLVPYRPGERAL